MRECVDGLDAARGTTVDFPRVLSINTHKVKCFNLHHCFSAAPVSKYGPYKRVCNGTKWTLVQLVSVSLQLRGPIRPHLYAANPLQYRSVHMERNGPLTQVLSSEGVQIESNGPITHFDLKNDSKNV